MRHSYLVRHIKSLYKQTCVRIQRHVLLITRLQCHMIGTKWDMCTSYTKRHMYVYRDMCVYKETCATYDEAAVSHET